MAQQKQTQPVSMRTRVRSLALLSGLKDLALRKLWCRWQMLLGSHIAVSCGVGRRHGSDLVLLWLWHRPAATAPIGPLA